MVLLLIVCAAVYVAFGDLSEALILGASVVLVVVISLLQEGKTERALQALRDLSSPQASVRRDGRAARIPASEVVPGDVLLLQEGDRVAADAVVVSATGFKVNESLLTGESAAVRKRAVPAPVPLEPSRRGHHPVRLREHARRRRQGRGGGRRHRRAERGRPDRPCAGDALRSREPTQAAAGRAGPRGGRRRGACCVAVVLVYGLGRADWKGGLLAGLTLAISLLPEEFPVVVTIFLALGAYRMARQQRARPPDGRAGDAGVGDGALHRQDRHPHREQDAGGRDTPTAIEGRPGGEEPETSMLRETAALACPLESFDPMDQATVEFARGESPLAGPALREYPLTPELPVMAFAHAWRGGVVVAAKGAPEAVAALAGWDDQARQCPGRAGPPPRRARAEDPRGGPRRSAVRGGSRAARWPSAPRDRPPRLRRSAPGRRPGGRGGVPAGRDPGHAHHRRPSEHCPGDRARGGDRRHHLLTGAQLETLDDQRSAPPSPGPRCSRASRHSTSCDWSRCSRPWARWWR